MRVAYVNQDRGVRPGRSKGAAVHVAAMRDAFLRAGADVLALDEPDDSVLRARLEHHLACGSIDVVYERHALGKDLSSVLCVEHGVPHVLEVNAPLLLEAERYRDHVPTDAEREREAALFRRSTRVVCVSSAVRDHVVATSGRDEGVLVEPNAVAPEFLADVAPAPGFCTPGRTVVGFHGRLRPWHAFERTVAVMRKLLDRGHDVELAIVGEGEFEDYVGLLPRDRVVHVEWVPPSEVAAHVARFDVVLLPYRADAPPWFSPLKLAEAMSLGAVPVVTDVGDLPLAVEHLVSGLVVPARDDDALLAATELAVLDRALRERMSGGARQRGRARTWDDVAAGVLDLVRPVRPTRRSKGGSGVGA
ncbi:MAG: glycosyltransferase family 4 protein [Planctomycetota bacterium]